MNQEPDPAIELNRLAGLRKIASGKVREVYAIDEQTLLIVATDRISAFDCILPDPIPRKGEVLTQMSAFWFTFLKNETPSHLIEADARKYPEPLRPLLPQLMARSMLVHRARMFPVECVARGYLAGSGWKEYRETGSVCGIALPQGLRDGDALPKPIFTPATKAETGHDENISFERMNDLLGGNGIAEQLRERTLRIYSRAADYARQRGIIIADTKFEWGLVDGKITLCDEALTPDSSRFWPAGTWRPGGPQPSYDKQFVRDYLESLTWDKRPPAPKLPPEIVAKTSAKYLEAYQVLTERNL